MARTNIINGEVITPEMLNGIGQEINANTKALSGKATKEEVGNLSQLSTTAKGNLVEAINEVNNKPTVSTAGDVSFNEGTTYPEGSVGREVANQSKRTTDLELKVNGNVVFRKVIDVPFRIKGSTATTYTSTYHSYAYQVKSGDIVEYKANEGVTAIIWGVINDIPNTSAGDNILWIPERTEETNKYLSASSVGDKFTIPSDCWILISQGSGDQTPKEITVNGNDILNGWEDRTSSIVKDINDIKTDINDVRNDINDIKTDINDVKTDIDDIKNSQKPELPDYYNNYLTNKIATINDIKLECQGKSDDFIFITDTHWRLNNKKSPVVIEELLRRGLTAKVVHGGDVCNSSAVVGHQDTVDEINFQNEFAQRLKKYGNVYILNGNHDYNGPEGDSTQGSEWNASIMSERLLQQNQMNGEITINPLAKNTKGNIDHLYYSFDNNVAKIRYICCRIITSDTQSIQNEWICEQIVNAPEGYDFIFFNHDGCKKSSGSNSKENEIGNLVDSVNNHSTGYVCNGKSFDFSNVGKIVAFISGHVHTDVQSVINGVAHIGVTADAHIGNYSYQGLTVKKNNTKNSVYEQAFDYILVDGTTVRCYRFGRGVNSRIFHADKHEIAVGGTLELTTSLSGTITWGAYDSNEPMETAENTLVEITNGFVRGLKVGESTIYANNELGDREFWGVMVE